MYEHILWTAEPFGNILNACPDQYERTIVLNGVSKAYAMTGWRSGYAAGPAPSIAAMKNVQSQSTSNPTSISQVAAQAALEGDQSIIPRMCAAFKERHDYIVTTINKNAGVRCLPSQGTFYTLPNVEGLIKRSPGVNNDVELAEHIMNQAGVALVPGSAFGAPGYLRLSFATDKTTLQEALRRINNVLNN